MQLRVVVRMDVDESGRDVQAVGVDARGPRTRVDPADLDDSSVRKCNVGRARRRSGAVDDRPARDDEIDLGAHSAYITAALRPNRPARASASIPSVYSRSSSTT